MPGFLAKWSFAPETLMSKTVANSSLNVQNTSHRGGWFCRQNFYERAPGVSIDQNNQISVNGKTGVNVMIDG